MEGGEDVTNKKKISASKTNAAETILEISTEGGSLSIQRFRTLKGKLKFNFITDESTMSDFLDEEDNMDLVKEYPPVDTFEEAIQLMNKYPWHEMHVSTVHHEYAQIFQTEKQKRAAGTKSRKS